MNKVLIIILLVSIFPLFPAEKELAKANDELVKRTIVILPFLNKNNVKKYGYIAGTLRDALKAKIVESKIFNLISFSSTDARIIQSGYTNDSVLEEANAKAIALKLKADIVIIGKYIIIEEKIMIQIDAIDIFTGQTVVSTSSKGDVGLDLFRVIDESTVDMTESLKQKFKEVKRSYFTEMSNLIRKEEMLKIFTPQVKAGIALSAAGGILFLAGLPVLIYDLIYYYDVFKYNLFDSPRTDENYDQYVKSYYTYDGLLIFGIIGVSLGIILPSIGIPLIAYKKKQVKAGFNIELSGNFKFEFYVKL